jgi:hypothetical protein
MRLPNFSLIEAVRQLLDLIACKISLWRRSVSRFGPRCEFLPFLKIEPSSKDEDTRPALFSLSTDTHLVTRNYGYFSITPDAWPIGQTRNLGGARRSPHLAPNEPLGQSSWTRQNSDDLATLQTKMQEYLASGAQLGWLIDLHEKKIYESVQLKIDKNNA